MHGRLGLFSREVIIVGGGPAGCAAAIWCAKFGLHVTLMEAREFPRDCPGETLHPGIEPLFCQLGVAEAVRSAKFLRHTGHWVQWDGDPVFVPFGEDEKGPWLGFQVWRADLDWILLEQARKLGVEILQPCQVREAIVEVCRVVGVVTSNGNYRADIVVDAGGGRHRLARNLNVVVEKHSPPLFVRYGYAEGACPVRDRGPAIVADPGGWVWTAKVREDLYQWTRLSFKQETLPHQWLPDELRGLKPTQRARGADVTWRRVVRPAGPGFFIVGDAAAILDPASSHGVLRGIMSGMQAAHAILRMTNDQFPEELAAREYTNWLSEWFFHDVAKLRELYLRHPTPPKWMCCAPELEHEDDAS